jgi:hypothetical protein
MPAFVFEINTKGIVTRPQVGPFEDVKSAETFVRRANPGAESIVLISPLPEPPAPPEAEEKDHEPDPH